MLLLLLTQKLDSAKVAAGVRSGPGSTGALRAGAATTGAGRAGATITGGRR